MLSLHKCSLKKMFCTTENLTLPGKDKDKQKTHLVEKPSSLHMNSQGK